MTTPESIVVSLEWAKKLKEAGLRQDSYLAWLEWCDGSWTINKTRMTELDLAAPHAEEILRTLPGTIELQKTLLYLRVTTDEVLWAVAYEEAGGVSKNVYKTDQSLANAAAAMYCFLAEYKLLPVSTSSQPIR